MDAKESLQPLAPEWLEPRRLRNDVIMVFEKLSDLLLFILPTAQEAPKIAPKAPKKPPRWSQDGPRGPQDGPKEGPKMAQEASKTPKMTSKTASIRRPR